MFIKTNIFKEVVFFFFSVCKIIFTEIMAWQPFKNFVKEELLLLV